MAHEENDFLAVEPPIFDAGSRRRDGFPLGGTPLVTEALDASIDDLVARARERAAQADLGDWDSRGQPRRWGLKLSTRVAKASVLHSHVVKLVAGAVTLALVAWIVATAGSGNTTRPGPSTASSSSASSLTSSPAEAASIPTGGSAHASSTSAQVGALKSKIASSLPGVTNDARLESLAMGEIVPVRWKASCRAAPELDRAARGTVCAVDGLVLELRQYPSVAALRAAFRSALSQMRSTRANACGASRASMQTSDPRERSWSRAEHPDQAVGSMVCGSTERGAEVRWSVDQRAVFVRAIRGDGDIDAVFRWWNIKTPEL